jgi:acyl-CoA thioester hydrolase
MIRARSATICSVSMPLSKVHTITVTVAASDIDELRHANNVAYVRWLQDVAIAHSNAVGLDFEAYERLGGVFVVRRQEVDYLRPVVRGARLHVRTLIDGAQAAKCTRMTEISTEDGTVACRAKTTWGYVDLATGRPARIPQVVRAAFALDA